MLKWALITAITMVSTTLLMFVGAYIGVLNETATFYCTSVSNVILLSNTFNIFYLIISPILFRWLKKHYSIIVMVASVAVAIGCIGRYLSGQNYVPALVFSIVVAIAHIPIITAPYGLLGLFEPEKRGYASSIPLFVPALGINFSILFGIIFISSEEAWANRSITNTYTLNLIIAIVGTLSALITIFLMIKLKP